MASIRSTARPKAVRKSALRSRCSVCHSPGAAGPLRATGSYAFATFMQLHARLGAPGRDAEALARARRGIENGGRIRLARRSPIRMTTTPRPRGSPTGSRRPARSGRTGATGRPGRSTWVAAAPVSAAASVTAAMLAETSLVPVAACWTLRAISWVAAPCSSTAAAIAEAMPLISLTVLPMPAIAATGPASPPGWRRSAPRSPRSPWRSGWRGS